MKQKRIKEWKEATERCGLLPEEVDMAKALGMGPKSLIKNIPNGSERWKAPVKEWIRNLYSKRFPNGHKHAAKKADADTPRQAADDVEEQMLIDQQALRDELAETYSDEENLFDEEHDGPSGNCTVPENEVAEQNRILERKRASLRRAGELVAKEFGLLDFVHKVVLFGSIARPQFKEIPRFHDLRRAGIKVWHESKDVDLAVWVSDLTKLEVLRAARSRAVNRHQQEIEGKLWPGVPHHQVDVFLLEQGTDRYRGNLCNFGSCPKGKPECHDAGCGALPFLRIFEGFHFDRAAPFHKHTEVLFVRQNPDQVAWVEGDVPF